MAKSKEIRTNAMRFLDRQKVDYEVIQYECDAFTDGVAVAKKTGVPVEQSFKTLVTEGKSRNYYVFVLPVDQELDLKAAARAVGEKSVEMIHVKDIQSITGYIRGGCSPLGMKKNYKTVVDESARSFDWIAVSGGRIGSTIKIAPEALVKVTGAVCVPVAEARLDRNENEGCG